MKHELNNATAFIEVEAFLELYPQRRDELLRRCSAWKIRTAARFWR
jgi:hypothetical protein